MKSFISKFSKYEIIWFLVAFSVNIIVPPLVSVFGLGQPIKWDYPLTVLATTAGLLSVLLVAKKNILNVPFGIVEVSIFGSLALVMGYMGDGISMLAFTLPVIVLSNFLWRRNLTNNNAEVKSLKLEWWGWLAVITGITVIASGFYFSFSTHGDISNSEYLLDSLSTAIMIFAMLLMLFRFREQWVLWIVFNILSITLYTMGLVNATGDVVAHAASTIINYTAYLVNSVYGLIIWSKSTK